MSDKFKERPILFNGPMVRAILEGRKTQTRRIIKPQPFNGASGESAIKQIGGLRDEQTLSQVMTSAWQAGFVDTTCPCGEEGDRLWVRETFRLSTHNDCPHYEPCNCRSGVPFYRSDAEIGEEKWKPSIHMPRWASRITLEITNIRVERLREMSQEDAYCEGVTRELRNSFGYACDESEEIFNTRQSKETFSFLWESIYGDGSWDANPWVWVIEFKRVEEKP
ncbi:hypothetical protein [Microbulbifer sp. TYP-18]|uniref:hypothetical protein n=1 Tax=Microbulbifer sp. TYP-18 TaxID=3230024 RepID=UPI0034C6332E